MSYGGTRAGRARLTRLRVFRIRVRVAVVDVLQPDVPGILGVMTDPHDHGHGHGHPHEPGHGHGHGAAPAHGPGWLGRVRHRIRPHSHEAADKVDAAMEASAEGMRALWISLAVLAATALLQAAVVAVSGSVALLGDTLHNAADALTAVPLGDRVPGRPAAADPPLHLRLRPGRGPGRRGHRR